MPSTYTPIATYTFASDGTGGAQVNFTSIPSTYTDLILIAYTADTYVGNNPNQLWRVNSDAGNNYSHTRFYGDSTNFAGSAQQTGVSYSYLAKPAEGSNFANATLHFMNYANTATNKTMLNRQSGGYTLADMGDVSAWVHLWRSTAAINSINLFPQTNFKAGSTFTLYGVKSA